MGTANDGDPPHEAYAPYDAKRAHKKLKSDIGIVKSNGDGYGKEKGKGKGGNGEGESDAPPRMFCAGCGSKVGPQSLSRVLSRLAAPSSPYACVVDGLSPSNAEDAAIIAPKSSGNGNGRAGGGGVLVHSIDYFAAMVEDPFVFGALAVNHALSDIYAMGGQPTSCLAIAAVPRGTDAKVEDRLYHMLAGACSVLARTGTFLGGKAGGPGAGGKGGGGGGGGEGEEVRQTQDLQQQQQQQQQQQ